MNNKMKRRLTLLGTALVVIGLAFVTAGGVAYSKVQDGYDSLQAFSEAQNVTLNYNEDGQLVDRGTTENAVAIRSLVEDTWKYPIVESDLDPDDPLVNTASEYMYQMATIVYHIQHGTQTVTLGEAVEYNGETFAAGPHEVTITQIGDAERVAAGVGGYWTDFDRMHPIEGPARGQAWSGTAHGLVGELGVGTVTHSTLQMGLAMAGLFAGLGAVFVLTGGGLIWAGRGRDTTFPDTVPESFTAEPVEARTFEKA